MIDSPLRFWFAEMPANATPPFEVLCHVLLALAAVITAGRVIGALFRHLGQPPVIGEVLAGILLGPSLLGWLWPAAAEFVLPDAVAPFLHVISQLGVILYMFLVGLEFNLAQVRVRAPHIAAIAFASMSVPFLLGGLLAVRLYPRFGTSGVPFSSFALFLSVALSITAFPVLARILSDRGQTKTELGVLALACAAANDAAAWCLLALVVGLVRADTGSGLFVAAMAFLFLTFMFFVAKPVAARVARAQVEDRVSSTKVAWVFVALLLSALATEAAGIHAVFGAFIFGAIIPHDSSIARVFGRKLEDVVTILLLPAFFAYAGMRTQIGLVTGWENWLWCGLIILTATAGKFGGVLLAARLTGLDWRSASALGVLMNTRGLMELIVLNIGLDLGVVSPTLFAMMVLMAIVTTLATSPILSLLKCSPSEPDA